MTQFHGNRTRQKIPHLLQEFVLLLRVPESTDDKAHGYPANTLKPHPTHYR